MRFVALYESLAGFITLIRIAFLATLLLQFSLNLSVIPPDCDSDCDKGKEAQSGNAPYGYRKRNGDVECSVAFNLTHSGKKDIRFSPLRGLIRCGCCGGVMMETFTQKKDKRYRYFACEKDMKRINSICPLKRVPAAELENLLLREIGSMLAKPEVIAGVMHQAAELDEHGKHLKLPTVQQAFDDLTNVWDVMFPVERYKFINEVVEKITVHIDRV